MQDFGNISQLSNRETSTLSTCIKDYQREDGKVKAFQAPNFQYAGPLMTAWYDGTEATPLVGKVTCLSPGLEYNNII